MSKKIFGTSSISWAICFSMFMALSAQAEQPATAAAQQLSGGSAALYDLKVMCGAGLLPVVIEGNLEGVVDVPRGKVSLSGKHARLGYCGYPVPGVAPSLVNTNDRSLRGAAASSITDLKGLHLSCVSGQLPFALKGSAEGSLSTSKGIVNLHGDRNEVAVCLVPAKSS